MKFKRVVLVAAMTIGIAVSADAQCGMMGSGGHQHGGSGSSSHEEHGRSEGSAVSKAYAFINDEGVQEATIQIKDGYHPNTLVVKKGIPLRLNFDLQEEGCTGTVVFKDFDVRRQLEESAITAVEFTPDKSGSFQFSCPMEMIRGTLVVKD